MPRYREEFIDITNEAGKPDRLLLLHIELSIDQVIRTANERTYLRIGDKSKEMPGGNLRNLEYAKVYIAEQRTGFILRTGLCPRLRGDEFDSVMNYLLGQSIKDFRSDVKNHNTLLRNGILIRKFQK